MVSHTDLVNLVARPFKTSVATERQKSITAKGNHCTGNKRITVLLTFLLFIASNG